MNFFTPCCAALLLVCASQGAIAQNADALTSKQYATCMDRTGTTTQGMVECTSEETQRQDKRLNQAYQAAMALQSPERKKQLQAAQRLWLKFRDANCGFYADPAGGSMARISANDCTMTHTAQRAKELEGFAATH